MASGEQQLAQSEQRPTALWGDWIYAAVTTLVGVTILILTPYVTNDESTLLRLETEALFPSFYPRAVGTLITGIGVWMLVRTAAKDVARRKLRRAAMAIEDPAAGPVATEQTTILTPVFAVVMVVYALAVNFVGFRSSTLVFGIGVSRWIGAPWWAAVVIGIALMVALSVLFIGFLGVPLPDAIY